VVVPPARNPSGSVLSRAAQARRQAQNGEPYSRQ
jgi:hypothetical protein